MRTSEKIELWLYTRAVIHFKRKHFKMQEAVDQMARWSGGVMPKYCKMMLKDMAKEPIKMLYAAEPKLPAPPPPIWEPVQDRRSAARRLRK